VLIVGFKGFKDFYADYTADQLKCRGIVIPLSEFPGQEMIATAIARLMERESFREALGREVKKQMEGESRIGFPALLGIRDPLKVKKDLEETIGVEVFEIPILPPSIPGMRIFRQFKEWLIQRGVTFLLGHSVLKADLNGKRCGSIEVSHPPLSQSYSADRFILATGRFIGGGLKASFQSACPSTGIKRPLVCELFFQWPSHSSGWDFDRSFFSTCRSKRRTALE
jgi:glycerol-3-phosphate dehydrogenase subunit B